MSTSACDNPTRSPLLNSHPGCSSAGDLATCSSTVLVAEGEDDVTLAQSRLGRSLAALVGKLALTAFSMMLAVIPVDDVTWTSIVNEPSRSAPLYVCSFWLGSLVMATVIRVATTDACRVYIFLEALRYRVFVQLRTPEFAYSLSDWSLVLIPMSVALFLLIWNGTSYISSAGIIGVSARQLLLHDAAVSVVSAGAFVQNHCNWHQSPLRLTAPVPTATEHSIHTDSFWLHQWRRGSRCTLPSNRIAEMSMLGHMPLPRARCCCGLLILMLLRGLSRLSQRVYLQYLLHSLSMQCCAGDLILKLNAVLQRRALVGERNSVLERTFELCSLADNVPQQYECLTSLQFPEACNSQEHPDYDFVKQADCCKCCALSRWWRCLGPFALSHLYSLVPNGEQLGNEELHMLACHFSTLKLAEECPTARSEGTLDDLSKLARLESQDANDQRHMRAWKSMKKWSALSSTLSMFIGNASFMVLIIVGLRHKY